MQCRRTARPDHAARPDRAGGHDRCAEFHAHRATAAPDHDSRSEPDAHDVVDDSDAEHDPGRRCGSARRRSWCGCVRRSSRPCAGDAREGARTADQLLRGSDEIARADSFHYGGPDATELLAIWRPIGLYVAFSEYPFYRTDGGLHFSGWAVTSADGPRSDGEVGVGSTVEEVHAAFGERFVTTDDVCGPPAFVTPPGEDTVAYRMVVVVDDEGEVVALFAGASPGC